MAVLRKTKEQILEEVQKVIKGQSIDDIYPAVSLVMQEIFKLVEARSGNLHPIIKAKNNTSGIYQ